MKAFTTLAVLLASGFAQAGDEPVQVEAASGEIRHAGHIYFNVATGERITTLIEVGDAQRPVGGDPGTEIWVVSGGGCAEFGSSTSFFFALDNPTGTSSGDSSPMLIDWGEIAMDTVVDCVQIHWITDHADTDTNSDSLADGVVGFAGDWVFYDAMNGRSPQMESISMPIIGLSFYSLPGEYPVDPGFLAFWTADIDLGATFGSSMTFEIGDTDSDLQGAAVHNPRMDLADNDSDSVPDIDPDQDGLADMGWSIDYTQPGTRDVDNADGDSDSMTGIDGDPLALATAGIVFGMPWPGHAEFTPPDSWEWVIDGDEAGINEDAFTLVEFGNNTGPYWFGGFRCNPYVPEASFQMVLYQNGADCVADIDGNGVLDFFDISAFLTYFDIRDPIGDMNGDGVFDFFDISLFLQAFAAGCP